ncbi:hypothetical protein QNH47_08815 [Virgibacillus halodenitrificans]|uniref:hypothetical protein n=1 Tax=Virgibacillus halodenitrificans TaxID=1482 RepID=UPI0024BFC951|nr:hypothetical protein [Virgibacillus halodenitrificans]WHX27931.1 hypothetical protein QNH47_08815 [Virgibacillus halodenitrificans]
MKWLQLHDLITPTNPYAALFFGMFVILIGSIAVFTQTKNKKSSLLILLAGILTILAGVAVLYMLGFYQ